MLKNKMIKTITIALAMAVIFSLTRCGKKKVEESDATVTVTNETQQVAENIENTKNEETQTDVSENQEQAETQDIDKPETDGGGNENNNSSTTKVYEFGVLVSEDTYYYNNAPITLDELISVISEEEGEKIVIITDNNATRNAYKDLTDKLVELEIQFEEDTMHT